MKYLIRILVSISLVLMNVSFVYADSNESFSLTIKVDDLRNSKGIVQFALYNENGSIPDDKFQKYYRIQHNEIGENSSFTVFKNVPKGKYAVNILHDENINGKIDKGFILPIEGIGFTNYSSISLTNSPNFNDASFDLVSNLDIFIKIIYF